MQFLNHQNYDYTKRVYVAVSYTKRHKR